ncbi:MAG: membrane or secreted protein [Lutibacter sp.]|uniref:membrane or secreted protein n=1 Tax=Lutibacter sp. TaxID=1925666 RepID=UPI0018103B64|nr:membrane or secreted protein [Lutibacter sp.]MBT8316893.1 membrane or secreted protein [Lutibacter sp.]NNJ57753.1 membrane or secreted protein [Lutibacter sp.]
MKKSIIVIISISFSFVLQAQGIIGAWETTSTSENGVLLKSVMLFADGYQVLTTYNATNGKFAHTNGGTWKLEDNEMTKNIEFDTDNPELVGTQVKFKVLIKDNEIEIVDSGTKFKRLDNGSPGKLQGAWLMSGRIRDGETQLRDTNRPRKTMKILSGTRFQWIAYNTETKKFMGTGGGTYKTVNGDYIENIEFFSRDDSKAGLSLKFSYELINGNWHHSGLSSKGAPIHEIWSIRK